MRVVTAKELLEIVLPTRSARSTHLELDALDSLEIHSVVQLQDVDLHAQTKTDSEDDSGDVSLTTVTADRIHIRTRPSISSESGNKPSSISLEVGIVPARRTLLWVAAIGCLMSAIMQVLLILSSTYFSSHAEGYAEPSERAELLWILRDTNAFSLAALIASVTAAALVVNQLHDVDRRVTVGSRIGIGVAAMAFCAALVLASFRLTFNDLNDAIPFTAWALVGVTVLFFILSITALTTTYGHLQGKETVHKRVLRTRNSRREESHTQHFRATVQPDGQTHPGSIAGIASEATLFKNWEPDEINKVVAVNDLERRPDWLATD